ncbi:hypothetical protein VOLCADRAFT_89155 [Volvox carteri f. nagariensis]|uniref:Uncharacterized protein n=1 Tax=Volvox carteri f. nagariensis TaxID=3068 RepID=D8TQY1_VOLCA|nr:uncharacterized protein VOLCADRAFT_89155 [Volvox carteri f. nagariensis]EFJ50106.1 hypothetical protein VOLCADRAFT_89155 [Volvox carteri f. nagariensis]|eukprot:XP_002948726.1 hypothetical protein VOLCADRAFT_89155 [Volvox carteri f. nagariensis]
MADISRREMGLIIGIVVGSLFLILLFVLAYILYDRQRVKKARARQLQGGRPPSHLPLPAGTGQVWTTINNSMVGLEICEVCRASLEAQGEQDARNDGAAQEGGAAGGGGDGGEAGTSNGIGKGKGRLTALLAWAWPPGLLRRLRGSGGSQNDSRRGGGGGGGGGAVDPTAADGVATSQLALPPPPQSTLPQQHHHQSARSKLVPEPAIPALQRDDAAMSMVVVELEPEPGNRMPTSPLGPFGLPLMAGSSCTGDAIVNLAVGAPAALGTRSPGSGGGAAAAAIVPAAAAAATKPLAAAAAAAAAGGGTTVAAAVTEKRSTELASCVVDVGPSPESFRRKAAQTGSVAVVTTEAMIIPAVAGPEGTGVAATAAVH